MISDILDYQNLFAWLISSVLMIGYRVWGMGYRKAAAAIQRGAAAARWLFAFVCLLCAATANAQPASGYHVLSYDATVKLDRLHDSLYGYVAMTARADSNIFEVLQHAKYIKIDSVFLRGQTLTVISPFDTASGSYWLFGATKILSGDTFTIHTYYHGHGRQEQYAQHWGGVDDEDSMMFAMGVGFQAPYTGCTRHWLPCYDLPDDKPDSVDLTFLCRDGDITASNGLLVSNMVSNGWRTMHWHVSHPIATYLLTFATGPYTKQDIPNALHKPFEVYALKRDSVEASIHMNVRVRHALAFYDSLFAPYPFEKVGYVATPIGSMEHQTMICLSKQVLTGDSAHMVADTSDISTVAVHELAHMWWGDRVTCKTFDDAWLNEGFARYCESLVLERFFGRGKYISRQHNNVAGAKTSTLPMFAAPTVDKHTNNYPYNTIYQKGAAVLGMLRQYLGDSLFFECVRQYGNAHAYSTATSIDLEQAFETASSQDLGWFFKPWVFGTGYPKDTIEWTRTSSGAHITFHQAMNNAATPYFRMAIPVIGRTKAGLLKQVTVWMDSTPVSMAVADFGFIPDTIVFDPDGLLVMRIVHLTQLSVTPAAKESGKIFIVYPNPNHDRSLRFEAPLPEDVRRCEVTVYDAQGRIVHHLTYDSVTSNFRGEISMSGLPSGSYRISIATEGGFNLTYPFILEP
jgi:aminopeptidase N